MAEHGLRSSAATAKGDAVNNDRSMTVTVREGLPAIWPIVDAFPPVGVSRGTEGGLPLKNGEPDTWMITPLFARYPPRQFGPHLREAFYDQVRQNKSERFFVQRTSSLTVPSDGKC
jgi:hypothetical protein